MGFCSNCGRQVRDEMRFCPDCGNVLEDDGGPAMVTGVAPPSNVPPVPGHPYPSMGPYPFPMYMRPPMGGRRLASVSGAVILVIDAALALLVGLIILIDWWDAWVGIILLTGAIMSIISAVAIFLSFNPVLALIGPPLLIMGAIAFWIAEPFAFFISMIGGSLAVVSLVLIIVGWRDSVARYDARAMGIHPAMAGQMQGMPWGAPPAYGGAEPPSMLKLRK